MVDGEGVLQAVGGDVPGGPEPAHVVDQHVQVWVPVQDLTGETVDLGLDGQVGREHVHGRAARCGADVASGGIGPGAVAANDAYSGTQGRQPGGGGLADAAGSPGDQDRLPGHQVVGVCQPC